MLGKPNRVYPTVWKKLQPNGIIKLQNTVDDVKAVMNSKQASVDDAE